jgi:hypothetical protein
MSMPESGAFRVPHNAVRVKLPHSEVCMHMRIAGQNRWTAKVSRYAAQIYSDDESPFSSPVLLAEAGLDEHGQPRELAHPTCTEFTVCYRDAANWKFSTRVVIAGRWDKASYREMIAPPADRRQLLYPRPGRSSARASPLPRRKRPSCPQLQL